MKIIRMILTTLFVINLLLLYLELKKKYIIMLNEDKNKWFSFYNRKDVEYLL